MKGFRNIGNLRKNAEKFLKKTRDQQLHTDLPGKEPAALAHELSLHHIELEMQQAQIKKSLEKLEKSLDRYSQLYELAPVAYFTLDPETLILESNFAGSNLLDMPGKLLAGQPFASFLWDGDRPRFYRFVRETIEKDEPSTIEIPIIQRFSGRMNKYAQISSRPLHNKEGVATQCLIAVSDISKIKDMEYKLIAANAELEKRVEMRTAELQRAHDFLEMQVMERTQKLKQANEELESSRQELYDLYAYVQSAREEERENISREIHDEVGQAMTALKMDLFWTVNKLADRNDAVAERLLSDIEMVDGIIKSMKRIITNLRPSILDHLGIGAAIEWLADDFQKRTGISCDISVEPENISLGPNLSITLFRLFQESLTNVARHAKASEVKAELKRTESGIKMEISDDGIGIGDKFSPTSFGLMGMRERVRRLDGNFNITGKTGNGTKVSVSIPVSARNN